MKLGLDTLAHIAAPTERRRVAILGGMGELGEEAPRYHEEVGVHARGRADVLIGVGALSKHYRPDHWFEDSNVCADAVQRLVLAGDCVFVKGSASAKMATIVNRLCDIAKTPYKTV